MARFDRSGGDGRERPDGEAQANSRWPLWMILLVVAAFGLLVLVATSKPPGTSYDYSTFVSNVEAGKVHDVTISSNGSITGTMTDGSSFSTTVPTNIGDTGLLATLQAHKVIVKATVSHASWLSVLIGWLPWIAIIGVTVWFWRRVSRQQMGAGGVNAFSRSRARIVEPETPGTTFADVAGYEEVKREVSEVVDFLRNPARYRRAGAMMPKGILLVGPPGTGKTLLARAVAGQAGVPFLSATGSSFMEIFVGVGASRVRDLFAEARKRAPAIVFIDEIDSVGQRRGVGAISHEERGQTLDQLLAEMDGFDPTVGIVVLAATNRPDVLDPALLRPGRFDRQVVVPLPNRAERLAILNVHRKGRTLAGDVDLDIIARGTPGFSGADLANLVNEAAFNAVRHDRAILTAQDFMDARDRVLLGLRRTASVLMPSERRAVAVHEAGHAIVAAMSAHGDPVAKVTILPSGQTLGVTEQLPVDERHLYPESYLQDSLTIRLGGRAAELLLLGEASTGASDDLAGATDIAVRMIREFGMSRALGPVSFGSDSTPSLAVEGQLVRPYAEDTQRVIDKEVTQLLRAAQDRARILLTEHRESLEKLVELLVEHETIDGQEVYRLLGVPPAETIALTPAASKDQSPSPTV